MKNIVAFFRDGTAEEWMGRVMVFLVIIPVIINIFSRNAVDYYSNTLENIALTAYVWIGYAGFGYLYKKDAHVDVKFVKLLLPHIGQQIIEIFRDVFILVFSVFITYWGIKLCRSGLDRMITGTEISYLFPYLSIVVGFFSSSVRSLYSLLNRILNGNKERGKNI